MDGEHEREPEIQAGRRNAYEASVYSLPSEQGPLSAKNVQTRNKGAEYKG
jgi:hypothetical protein